MSKMLSIALLSCLSAPALAQDSVDASPAGPVDASPLPAHRTSFPDALAPRPFQLPEAKTAKLSNGTRVLLVENHEVPLVYVNVVSANGSWTDPDGKAGLASVTLDMMDEGAGDYTAEGLSIAARKLGADLSTFAAEDYAGTSLSVLRRNLEPALDLLADVTLRPTFPGADWEILQKKRIQDLAAAAADPNRVASRVFDHLMFGDTYAGRLRTEADYSAISPGDMASWHAAWMRPDDAIILVGGDTTLAEIKPLLESRFGAWTANGDRPSIAEPSAEHPEHPERTVYLHDMPGAPQSVVMMGSWVMDRTHPMADPFVLANRAYGGQFMSRLNLNLREDKSWTYGARSRVGHYLNGSVWTMSSSVVTPHTVEAVSETWLELQGLLDGGESTSSGEPFGPLDNAELNRVRDGLLYTWPLSFEQPSYLLMQRLQMWRYDLPADWLSTYTDRLRAVELEQASAAWKRQLSVDDLVIVIVGDASVVRSGLVELGLTVVDVDADGSPISSQ